MISDKQSHLLFRKVNIVNKAAVFPKCSEVLCWKKRSDLQKISKKKDDISCKDQKYNNKKYSFYQV